MGRPRRRHACHKPTHMNEPHRRPVPPLHYHCRCPLCRAIPTLKGLIPQHRACLFDTTSLTSATFMKVHSEDISSFPGLQHDHSSPGKLLLNYLSSTHNQFALPPQACLPNRMRRHAPISDVSAPRASRNESAVLGAKSASIESHIQIGLGLWKREPLDLLLAYSVLDAVPWGKRGRQRKLGFFFD